MKEKLQPVPPVKYAYQEAPGKARVSMRIGRWIRPSPITFRFGEQIQVTPRRAGVDEKQPQAIFISADYESVTRIFQERENTYQEFGQYMQELSGLPRDSLERKAFFKWIRVVIAENERETLDVQAVARGQFLESLSYAEKIANSRTKELIIAGATIPGQDRDKNPFTDTVGKLDGFDSELLEYEIQLQMFGYRRMMGEKFRGVTQAQKQTTHPNLPMDREVKAKAFRTVTRRIYNLYSNIFVPQQKSA